MCCSGRELAGRRLKDSIHINRQSRSRGGACFKLIIFSEFSLEPSVSVTLILPVVSIPRSP